MTDNQQFTKPATCKACTVWLSCNMIEAAEERASQDGVSLADVVGAALAQYLGRPDLCARE